MEPAPARHPEGAAAEIFATEVRQDLAFERSLLVREGLILAAIALLLLLRSYLLG